MLLSVLPVIAVGNAENSEQTEEQIEFSTLYAPTYAKKPTGAKKLMMMPTKYYVVQIIEIGGKSLLDEDGMPIPVRNSNLPAGEHEVTVQIMRQMAAYGDPAPIGMTPGIEVESKKYRIETPGDPSTATLGVNAVGSVIGNWLGGKAVNAIQNGYYKKAANSRQTLKVTVEPGKSYEIHARLSAPIRGDLSKHGDKINFSFEESSWSSTSEVPLHAYDQLL